MDYIGIGIDVFLVGCVVIGDSIWNEESHYRVRVRQRQECIVGIIRILIDFEADHI